MQGLQLELSWNENEGWQRNSLRKEWATEACASRLVVSSCRDSCLKTVRERIRNVRTFNGCAVCGVTGEAEDEAPTTNDGKGTEGSVPRFECLNISAAQKCKYAM